VAGKVTSGVENILRFVLFHEIHYNISRVIDINYSSYIKALRRADLLLAFTYAFLNIEYALRYVLSALAAIISMW